MVDPKKKQEKFELRPVQYRALGRVMALLKNGPRVLLVWPTGSGKTFVTAAVIDELAEKSDRKRFHVLWLDPSPDLYYKQMRDLDAAGYEFGPKVEIELMSYSKITMRGSKVDIAPDLVILDEAHRVGAEKWGAAVENLGVMYPSVPMFGNTATRVRGDGVDIGKFFFNDNVAEDVTIAGAWKSGDFDLTKPKYVRALYDKYSVLERLNEAIEADRLKQDAAVQAYRDCAKRIRSAANAKDVVQAHIPKPDGRYAVFCPSVDDVEQAVVDTRDWFDWPGVSLRQYKLTYREPNPRSILEAFERDDTPGVCKVIYSVNMLSEGYHCDFDGIIMCRCTKSSTLYTQLVGRVIKWVSAGDGEKVIIDLVDNISNISAGGGSERGETLSPRKPREKRDIEDLLPTELDMEFTIVDEVLPLVGGDNVFETAITGGKTTKETPEEILDRFISMSRPISERDGGEGDSE